MAGVRGLRTGEFPFLFDHAPDVAFKLRKRGFVPTWPHGMRIPKLTRSFGLHDGTTAGAIQIRPALAYTSGRFRFGAGTFE